jgi:16S rRNA (uracil1498-N3)-methyltransferase
MNTPRFFIDTPLRPGERDLPDSAARHVQVLRLQPGREITLFDGLGGEWQAVITDMKKRVAVTVHAHAAIEREAARHITLAVGIPANDKMDWLIEKATELGVTAIQPLMCERTVLRLSGERAQKKLAHWRGVAVAASEQCGRNRVPVINATQALPAFLSVANSSLSSSQRFVLSPLAVSRARDALHSSPANTPLICMSGPEGGLSEGETQAAMAAGFAPLCLGARVLRAETAPLVVLALCNTP